MLPQNMRIQSKFDLKSFLEKELCAYSKNPIINCFLVGEGSVLRRHQLLLRKTEYFVNTKKKIFASFYKFKLQRFQAKYGLNVPLNCCGKGLRIMHLGPVLINSKATLGENVCIHINTAIVAGGTNDLVPTIGNGVVIGVGAVVLGGVTIADNIAIGANAVVNKDFLEENIAIAGVPAKKISNNGRLFWGKTT